MLRRLLCCSLLVLSCFVPPAFAEAHRGLVDLVMPQLTVSNPSPGVVYLDWKNLPPSSYAIVWQDGHDTLWPDTGHHEIDRVSAGEHAYEVCVPAQPYDVCTPSVTAEVD